MPRDIRSLRPSGTAKAAALALSLLAAAPAAAAAAAPGPHCHPHAFTLYFERQSAELGPDAQRVVSAAQHSLRRCVIDHVRILGLAGGKPRPGEKLSLSQRRAQAVADALAAGGWPRDRLELVARGDAGATVGDADKPVRRRVRVSIDARPGT